MKSPRAFRRRHSSRGFALLAVLAIITLVVILLLSYLITMTLDRKTTANYTQSIKAQEIGLGALQEITSDLKAEIVAGSNYDVTVPVGSKVTYSYTDPVTGQPIITYTPATDANGISQSVRPARIGFPAADYGLDVDTVNNILLPPTLVRVSRDKSDPFYNPGPSATYYPQKRLLSPLIAAPLPLPRATTTWTTTATSVNGRTVSLARWNKPMLMGSSTPSVFNNVVINAAGNTGPPEWVYVGRGGSLNTTTGLPFTDAQALSGSLYADAAGANPNAILGRYAYVIYDEGALLDANVAGANTATAGTAASPLAPFRNKTYLSYADLTQIPIKTQPSFVGLPQTALDNLVNWRNQGGLVAWGNYTNLVTGADANTGFLTGFGPGNTGASSAYPTTTAATHNDNPFLSRQDLIDYVNQEIMPTLPANSLSPLPYLGTFSRAVNAPTASPYNVANLNGTTTANSTYAAVLQAENTSPTTPAATSGTPNRDMANVRLWLPNVTTGTAPVTITHYKDDGTPTTYTIDPGAPLLQRRFSLAKLAWIGYNGPNSAAFNSSLTPAQQATAIQDCFGLVWDTGQDPSNANLPYNTWDYVGCTHDGFSTANPPNVIYTLAQVASLTTPREPDFFELLKAAILNGSVGRDPGPAVAASNSPGVTGALFDSYSAQPDAHIVQIGANIIDQATTDGYPTAIYFAQHNPATYPAPFYRLFDTAFGIKDLPYFYRIFPQHYTTSLTGNTTFPNAIGTCQGWFQPELWNPHQNPSTGTTPTTRPGSFRVRAHGGAQFSWHQLATQGTPPSVGNDQGIATDPPATINYESSTPGTANYSSANPPNPTAPSCAYFNDPNGNVFREQPILLTTSNANIVDTNSSNQCPNNQLPSGYNPEYVNAAANQFIGIWVGSDSSYNPNVNYVPPPATAPDAISHICAYKATATVPAGSPAYPTLALEYEDPSGNYHPYALMSRFIEITGSNSTGPTAASNQKDNLSTWCVANTGIPTHMDPRTDRFSGSVTSPDPYAIIDAPNWTYPEVQTTVMYGTASGIAPLSKPPIPSGVVPYFFYVNGGTLTSGSAPTTPDYLTTWMQNQTPTQNAAQVPAQGFLAAAANDYSYYLDPDQVPTQGVTIDSPRPADGFRYSNTASSHGNGIMLYHTSAATPAGPTGAPAASFNNEAPRRPVILNRPFRSVGELGYTFRDVPFKSLDFWSQYSPDAALLDVFSVQDEPAVVAGQFNPNNAPTTVLKAILSGGAIKEIDPTVVYSSTDLTNVATAIATYISTNPLKNRQDLVTAGGAPTPSITGADLSDKIYTALTTGGTKTWANKAYGEAPVRALAAATNIRTWNLMIDVIAQSGHMIKNAKTLSDFAVDGEKRYWLHIAIDRYTGQVVDEQLEPVYE